MKYENTPGLVCDEEHVYRYEGTTPLGVSEVMEEVGLENGKWFDETDSSRGRAVHAALAQYARGKTRDELTTFGDLHQDLWGWFFSGADFLDEIRAEEAEFLGVEVMRYHPLYRFCGTIDLVVRWRKYEHVLDFKSGKASRVVRFKMKAYDMLLGPTEDGKPRKCAAVEVQQDGGRAKLITYDTPDHFNDFARFLSYLTTARDRREFGPKKY